MAFSRRTAWLASGILAAAGLLVLLLGWWLWLPGAARGRVEGELASRFGLDAQIGELSIGWSRIALREVTIQSRDGSGVHILVPEVHVEASPWGLAFRGREAIDHIRVEGLRAELDVDERGAARLLDRLAGGSRQEPTQPSKQPAPEASDDTPATASESPASDQAGISPTWLLSESDVEVRDAHGRLFAMRAPRIEQAPDVLKASIERVELGNQASEAVHLRELSVEVVRHAGRRKLQRLEVAQGEVLLPRQTDLFDVSSAADPSGADPAASPVPERVTLRRRLQHARAPLEAEPSASGASPNPDPSPQDAVDQGASSSAKTVQADAGRSEATEAPAEPRRSADAPPAKGSAKHADASAFHTRWLASGAVIAWSDIQVETHPDGDDGKVWVRDAEGRVHAPDANELHLTGSGGAEDGGTLGWDVHVWPAEARARGRVDLEALPLGLITPFLPAIPWHEPQRARLDASLNVRAESPDRLAVSGQLALQDAALASERIAPDPIEGISFRVTGKGHWLPLQRKLEVSEARFEMGDALATMNGAVTWASDHYLFDLTAELPRTSCDRAVGALPKDLLGELSAFSWRGGMSAGLRAYIDSRALAETQFEIDVDEACEFVTVPAMADVTRFQMPFTHHVVEPDDSEFEFLTGPGTPTWAPLDRISPFLVHAVLAHEDPTFFRHQGFVPPQIENAIAKNLEAGRYVVGASTITMQLVKNLFLHREKTLQRKIQEAFLTWWVEESLDKAQILELYLNIIEYGPEIYGIRPAARHYFNRSPNELSPGESVFIANILPNPKRYHHYFEQRSIPEHFKARMRRQMERMKRRGWYSPEAADYGMQELEAFEFHPNDGMLPPPRLVPGDAAPLPYQIGYNPELDSGEWEWPLDGEGEDATDAQLGGNDEASSDPAGEGETPSTDPSFSAATPAEE